MTNENYLLQMYIVYKGSGKLEESSSTLSKPQTTTFLVKPKSLSSQQNPSIDSTAVPKQIYNAEYEVEVKILILTFSIFVTSFFHMCFKGI